MAPLSIFRFRLSSAVNAPNLLVRFFVSMTNEFLTIAHPEKEFCIV
jgi:hypothetical protein